jgi:hypothetical protein
MQRYATVSGLPVDEMDYYVILARFKIAIVLEGGYARYVPVVPTTRRWRCSATSCST